MTNPLMTETLPTIVGMGVVSRTTETVLGKGRRGRGRSGSKSGSSKAKRPHATVVVGVSDTRSGAESYATGYRRVLKSQGRPRVGKVKVKKVSGGYAAVYYRG